MVEVVFAALRLGIWMVCFVVVLIGTKMDLLRWFPCVLPMPIGLSDAIAGLAGIGGVFWLVCTLFWLVLLM